jgi:hypothetical protein
MAIKKSELYYLSGKLRRTAWRDGCFAIQRLRVGAAFVKYVSDKYAGQHTSVLKDEGLTDKIFDMVKHPQSGY